MIQDYGTVRPGTTLYIPFHTFDSNDPSASVTLTGLATTDIEIYKDGGTTQRASDNGYALLDTDGIDFDAITGIHGISVNLADNSTAGFYAAGSQYWIVISSITVDAATINFILATFRIGYEDAVINTTIATLASQTSFTLTAGPAEDDALNGQWCIIHDVASAVQLGKALILDYTGSTKTVTLAAGTTFTAAATDNISIMGMAPLQPTTLGRTLDVSTGGEAGLDWANIGSPTTAQNLSATNIDVDQVVASVSGAVGSVTGAVGSVTGNVGGNVTGSIGSVATGGITAGSIAADAIGASELAADAIAEIADAVWDEDATGHQTQGTFGQAIGDPVADTNTIFKATVTDATGATVGVDGASIKTVTDQFVFSQGGRVDAQVLGIETDAITSASFEVGAISSSVIAPEAIGASQLAADAVAEIQAGIILASGTIGATGNTTTALHLAGIAWANDAPNSLTLVIKDVSTGLFYSRWIEDWADTGDLATVATLPFTPQASTDLYWILPMRSDVTGGSGLDAAGVRAALGMASADLDTQLAAKATATNLATLTAYVDTEVAAIKAKTDNLPSDPADASDVAALLATITGYIDTEVASILAAVDTEVAAIKAKTDNLPASPANEATLTTIAGYLDTEVAAILAAVDTEVAAIKAKTDNLPTDPADASDIAASFASIASTLSTLSAYVDTEVAAIKAKTDSLTFTVANVLDANIQRVNDVAVAGTGASGDEWGPV